MRYKFLKLSLACIFGLVCFCYLRIWDIEAEGEILDMQSVEKAIEILGSELSKVDDDEIAVLKRVNNREVVPESDIYTKLKGKNIIFVYDNHSESNIINPVVMDNRDFQTFLKQ